MQDVGMATIQGLVAPGIDPVWLARQLARFNDSDGVEAVALIRAYEQADRLAAARERGDERQSP